MYGSNCSAIVQSHSYSVRKLSLPRLEMDDFESLDLATVNFGPNAVNFGPNATPTQWVWYDLHTAAS